MTEDADTNKWERIAPKRLEKVVDALRVLSRTAGKDYDPIPEDHAKEMLVIVHDSVSELYGAYNARLGNDVLPEGGPATPAEPQAEPAAEAKPEEPKTQKEPTPGRIIQLAINMRAVDRARLMSLLAETLAQDITELKT